MVPPVTADLTADAAGLTDAARTPQRRVFLVLWGEPGRASRVIELDDGGELTVGRSRAATIAIDHERVSRMHTRVRRAGDRVIVEDLGSRNGTRVGGVRIEGATEVAPGDEIVVGPLTLVVGASSTLRVETELVDVAQFEQRLAAELDRARRYRRPVTVAMMRIADDTAIGRLAAAARRMDTVADYGADDLALILPELDGTTAAAEVERLLAAAGVARVPVGIASTPHDGVDGGQLVAVARDRLRGGSGGGPSARAEVGNDAVPIIADPAMRALHALAARIADTGVTVLIEGETGSGKELVAQALHRHSARRDRPRVELNCAALPEALLESELFGHERGAFTSADRRKLGFFEAADGGTLFLDEIGEMPPALQAKLLRVLERKVITRVGGTAEVPVDVRVVCATHRDLEAMVRAGQFREDLYFRVAGFTLVVPPLRDRPAEIPLLAEHFARSFAAELGRAAPVITPAAHAVLAGHAWPGNVRELKNVIDRAMVLAGDGPIGVDELPEHVIDDARRHGAAAGGSGVREQVADVERAAIVSALAAHDGNQTRAARQLGLSRRALIYKMEKYGLKPPPSRGDS